jgi:hypothetical protein
MEAALALTQVDLGIISQLAGDKIAMESKIELIDEKRLESEQTITGHYIMPLVSELSRVVGSLKADMFIGVLLRKTLSRPAMFLAFNYEKTLLGIATTTAVCVTLILLIMTMIEGPLATLVIPIFTYMTSVGMTITNSFTLAMETRTSSRKCSCGVRHAFIKNRIDCFFSRWD